MEKAIFITWSISATYYLLGWAIITTALLFDGIKYLQNKLHGWANQQK